MMALAILLAGCAAWRSAVHEEVRSAATPREGLIVAADHLYDVLVGLHDAAFDTPERCAAAVERLTEAYEACVIAEKRFLRALKRNEGGTEADESLRAALDRLASSSQPKTAKALERLRAQSLKFAGEPRVQVAWWEMDFAREEVRSWRNEIVGREATQAQKTGGGAGTPEAPR